MPRLILKCPYLKGGSEGTTAHLSNLVKYIANSKNAEKIKIKNLKATATKKQDQLIRQIVDEFPNTKNLFEYEDYIKDPTKENATDFISIALEQNFDQMGKRKNYVDYIANRPRVEKIEKHGLFTSGQDVLVISRIADEVANHTGNVWTPIISLRREDAVRLGFDNAERWYELLSQYVFTMADCFKILDKNFKWYAAFHNESHHPHIHMICYSTNPKEGYLTKKGIEKMKSGLVKEIFGDELKQIYVEQSKRRDDLKQESRDTLLKLIEEMKKGTLQNSKVEAKIMELSNKLKHVSGKKQYGYLRPQLKQIVNDIVDELSKDERVEQAYKLWYEMRKEVLHSYLDDLPEPLPLSGQKEFKSIKNMIIKESDNLNMVEWGVKDEVISNETFIEDGDRTYFLKAESIAGDNILNTIEIEKDMSNKEKVESNDSGENVCLEWNEEYKMAKVYLYGSSDEVEQDFNQAFEIFESEAKRGNALAMFDIGRMYADGLGHDVDLDKSQQWYAQALSAFHMIEDQKPWKYTQYRIGKMYAQGLGTEQDYESAAYWLTLSTEENYKYAQYSLAGLYYRGQGVEQSFEQAFRLYLKSAEQGFPYANFEVAKMYRDGIGTTVNIVEAEEQFASAFIGFEKLEQQSHDDKIQYRLGWMLLNGIGTEKDILRAKEYFEKSATLGNTFACYSLAKLILNEENPNEEEVKKAIQYLQTASDNENQFAQYSLAKIYLSGKHVEKDVDKAIQLFKCSAEQENEYAAYQLGRLYLKGEDISKNIPMAINWLSISAEQGNQFAEYSLGMLFLKDEELPKDIEKALGYLKRSAQKNNEYANYMLGKLYLIGEEVPKDIESAIYYFTESANQGNQFAQYFLGKLYLMGRDVPQDKEKAIKWFVLSAEQGNEYAQFFLDNVDKFNDSSIAFMVTRMLHHLSRVFESDIPIKSEEVGFKVDSKRLKKLREKKRIKGHKNEEQWYKM